MFNRIIIKVLCFGLLMSTAESGFVFTQTQARVTADNKTLSRYLDQTVGMTADEAVRIALENNGELIAMRKERDAAKALIDQARLRPNPSVEFSRQEQIGGKDNDTMIAGSLPLELGGRRNARIAVAESELAVREKTVEDRERLLASEVRMKFGEALAATLKLKFAEDVLETVFEQFRLVQARVTEGKTAPLEENMTLVEVNRLRSIRETQAGNTEIAFLELRNLLGMKPEQPLQLRGGFDNLVSPLPILSDATANALQLRPDLAGLSAMEDLADAQIKQAKAGGRIDASVNAGYGRNNFGFPVNGVTDTGQLRPVQGIFHSLKFGVTLEIPVRNRNQGNIAATAEMREAARNRREFGELIVRREVATAFARYESSAKAMEIFRVGVRGQASANLDVVRQTYELGSRNLIEYLIEARRYIEIENEFIDMQLAVYQSIVEMLRATNSPELIKK
ncbi:MAG: TolC family protein [Pyrinomonadaceae bacterium]